MSETETPATPAATPEVAAESTPAVTSEAAPQSSEVAVAETTPSETTPPQPLAADAPPVASSEKPSRGPQNKRPKRGQNRKGAPADKEAGGKEKSRNKNRDKNQDPSWVSYQPADIIKRMQNKRAIWEAYMEDAVALSLQIRQWGLGASLAVLLAQTQSKRKRRLYWDLSKWMLKERKLKGKNSRSLIESVLYGDAFYLLRATEASLGFLEEILFLGQQKTYQPLSGKEKAPEKPAENETEQAPTQAETEMASEEEASADVAFSPEAESSSEVESSTDMPAVPVAEIEAEPSSEILPEIISDQNDETRSAPVHA